MARVSDPSRRVLFASLGAALFILVLGALDSLTRGALAFPALIPPFGASTVIVFFAPDTPASRPWNVIVGQLSSALVAALVLALLPTWAPASQAALAVSGAALAMVATRSVHPPGGATALLAVISERHATRLSDLLPLVLGCVTLVAVRRLLDLLIAWGAKRKNVESALSPSALSRAVESIPPVDMADG